MQLRLLFFTLAVIATVVAAQDGPLIPDTVNIPPDTDLNNLPNKSLYLRWRQTYHVLPAGGHSNDPCAPMYDPTKGIYHLFYQSFPNHVGFGNTSWSHATSPDLVNWTDITGWENQSMVAIPTGPYPAFDWIGAFSGGGQAVNLQGQQDGNLTVMYTGASRFPDNWQVPYKLMTEQQGIATSNDGGQTWQKYAGNPVISDAPGGWNVTGWRDPLFAESPLLDDILGYEANSSWYLTFGSGIRGIGPRIPLYRAPASDLTNWTFLGGLYEIDGNFSFGGTEYITGNHGYNYEMSALFAQTEKTQYGGDGQTNHWTITAGAESPPTNGHPLTHWSLWSFGNVSGRANGSAEYTITAAGVLDWGNSYALNQFYDPVGDRRLIWRWIDEDLNLTGVKAQGFQGSQGVLRELYVLVSTNVVAPAGGVSNETDALWIDNGNGTYTVKTLGQRPAPDVIKGIQGNASGVALQDYSANSTATIQQGVNSSHFHIDFRVPSVPANSSFSILFRASPGFEEYTNITYVAANSSIIVNRDRSTLLPNLLMTTYLGHLTPYSRVNPSEPSTPTTDPLDFSLYVDGSLFEISINDRFALSARTYPSRADATFLAFEAAGPGTGGDSCSTTVMVTNITYWDTMYPVWPERPLNASSPLVFDGYCQTHVCFPNPYVDEGVALYAGYKRR